MSKEKREAAEEAQAECSFPQVLLADSFQKVPSMFPCDIMESLLLAL